VCAVTWDPLPDFGLRADERAPSWGQSRNSPAVAWRVVV
jgi:hypothetical protein